MEKAFELDLNFLRHGRQHDYALLRLKDFPALEVVNPTPVQLNSGEEIRLIHHPLGKPAIISDLGQILQLGEDYIDHNIITDRGSSGAPIFNLSWNLIALHQGDPGIGRNTTKGCMGGVPVRTIWQQISPYLT